MNGKRTRAAIAFILVLGLILSTASIGFAAPTVKPMVSAEILSISGGQDGEIQFQYSWNNATPNSSLYYKIEIGRTLITASAIDVGAVSGSGLEYLSFPNPSSGTYKMTAQLIKNNKNVTKVTDAFRYVRTVSPTSYTVTFDETNNLDEVSVQVYSDSGLNTTVGAALITNASGEAIINLPNGTYYYKANKFGYQQHTDDFTVSSAALTEGFTMAPSVYTATFHEANNLTGVSVQVYSDAGFTTTVGSVLTTDVSGDAITSLPNGNYYIKATMTGYDDYYASIPLTINNSEGIFGFQLLPVNHTWTFQEYNNLSGVAIQFYSDGTCTTPTSISGMTDFTGSAIFYDLPHGEYWWKATLEGYEAYTGHYNITGDTYSNFEMTPVTPTASAVTFAEANNLSGVNIQLYDDPWTMTTVGSPLTTNSTGEAVTDLSDGVYYYIAARSGYDEKKGEFTVSGSTIETFEMVPVMPLLFEEHFTGVTEGAIPLGWSATSPDLVGVHEIGDAWGDDPAELWILDHTIPDLPAYNEYRISTPAIDCTAAETSLNLSFQNYFCQNAIPVSPAAFVIKVQISTDGGITWVDTPWVYTSTETSAQKNQYGDIGPETVNIDLSDYVGETINLSWYLEGDTYWGTGGVNWWTIDDVVLSGDLHHDFTFAEATSMAGVYVQIFGNEDYSVYQSAITDETGVASFHLLDGYYWYQINAVGYQQQSYWFILSGEDSRYDFAMADSGIDYTVTFAAAASLPGVEIQVYSYNDDFKASLTTNSLGEATIALPDGSYRFGANAAGYDTCVFDFTVQSVPATVDFTMVSTPAVSMPYLEDFTDDQSLIFPAGWRTNDPSVWEIYSLNNSGGTSPELRIGYWPPNDDAFMAISPAIDASSSSGLQLSFGEMVDWYNNPFTLQVKVSTDGGVTWGDPVWSVDPTGNINAEIVTIDLSAYDGQIINIAWILDGINYNIDYWYLDDISVTDSSTSAAGFSFTPIPNTNEGLFVGPTKPPRR